MRTRLISLCVLVLLSVAACGSDKKATSSKDTTPASTSPPTTVSAAADMETAKKLVLVAGDFPPGWTAKPDDQTQSPEDKATAAELSACVGTTGDESETARWSGDGFSKDQYEISSDANLVKDKDLFAKDVDAIKGPKLQSCTKDTFTKVLTKQLGEAPASVDAVPLQVTQHGDVTVGLRMTVKAGSDTVYLDLVLLGRNRAEVTATIFSVGQPPDAALEKTLLDKLGSRVDAA